MTDLEIRRFEPGDGEAVRALNETAMARTPEWIPWAPDDDLEDVPGHYLDEGEFLVGVSVGEIVATAAYEPLNGWMAEEFDEADERTTVELSRMRVAPDRWDSGYGTRIYDELEQRARADGVSRFVLNTGIENERARGFYRARDFEHVRDERVTFGSLTMHLALYRKRITRG